MIKIILVDDHAVFRKALSFVLAHQEDMQVVAQAGTLHDAREVLHDNPVDIAVVDLSLPDGDGVDLIRDLRHANPHAAILVLSASDRRRDFARAVEAGASGICQKTADVNDVLSAIRRLAHGESLLGPAEVIDYLRMAGEERQRDWAAQGRLSQLTRREREVLIALADGLSDKDIGERLAVSPETIRSHMVSIFAKLNVDSRLQALLFAMRHGAINLDQLSARSGEMPNVAPGGSHHNAEPPPQRVVRRSHGRSPA
jgi:DNA-binding NarL/FixJ family response regulator